MLRRAGCALRASAASSEATRRLCFSPPVCSQHPLCTTTPSPYYRERKPTQKERDLAEAVEQLRTRIEAGEADVEVEVEAEGERAEGAAEDGDEDAVTMTVQQLLESKEVALAALTFELDEKMRCASALTPALAAVRLAAARLTHFFFNPRNKRDGPKPGARKEREPRNEAAWKRGPRGSGEAAAPVAAPITTPVDATEAPAADAGKENAEGEEDGFQEVAARGSKGARQPPKEAPAKDAKEAPAPRAAAFSKERREESAAAAPKGARW